MSGFQGISPGVIVAPHVIYEYSPLIYTVNQHMSIDDAKATFLRLKPEIDALKAQMKTMKKEMKGACSFIYNYMRENGIETMDVGDRTFSLQEKTRVKFTRQDFETLVEAAGGDMTQYQITEQKGSIKRRRT